MSRHCAAAQVPGSPHRAFCRARDLRGKGQYQFSSGRRCTVTPLITLRASRCGSPSVMTETDRPRRTVLQRGSAPSALLRQTDRYAYRVFSSAIFMSLGFARRIAGVMQNKRRLRVKDPHRCIVCCLLAGL